MHDIRDSWLSLYFSLRVISPAFHLAGSAATIASWWTTPCTRQASLSSSSPPSERRGIACPAGRLVNAFPDIFFLHERANKFLAAENFDSGVQRRRSVHRCTFVSGLVSSFVLFHRRKGEFLLCDWIEGLVLFVDLSWRVNAFWGGIVEV